MEVNTDEIAKKCMDAINEKLKNLKKLNIIVVGKSGVGKSTLINSLFRDKIAETGLGRPITTEIRKIEKKDYPMAIYDTPGFELSEGQQAKVKEEIIELIHKGLQQEILIMPFIVYGIASMWVETEPLTKQK